MTSKFGGSSDSFFCCRHLGSQPGHLLSIQAAFKFLECTASSIQITFRLNQSRLVFGNRDPLKRQVIPQHGVIQLTDEFALCDLSTFGNNFQDRRSSSTSRFDFAANFVVVTTLDITSFIDRRNELPFEDLERQQVGIASHVFGRGTEHHHAGDG